MSVPFTPEALAHLEAGPDLLVALDIDGTILSHEGVISLGVRAAIADLAAAGTHLVLSTGRSLPAVTPILAELNISAGWAVCSNGSVTVRLDPEFAGGCEIVDVATFDPGPTLRLLRQHLPDGIFAVEDLGRGFKVTAPFPEDELSGDVRVVDFEELCAEPASRVTLRAPGLESADFHDLVARTGLDGVAYAVGWTAWLDISPAGTSKASALDVVRQRLGVVPENTLAAGDGRNDIEMLEWAAVGVAMGGADGDTLAAADVYTAGVEEDGLVPVLTSLVRERVL